MHPIFAWLPHGLDWFYILLFFVVFGAFGSLLWIAALISCLTKESSTENTKVAWAVVILFTHFLGGLLYFLVRRPQRIRELGR